MSVDFKKIQNKPVFIMGYPKSGTTLMSALLDNHPELVVFTEELKFFQRIIGPSFYKNLSKQNKKDILLHFCLNKFKINRESQFGTGNRQYSNVDFNNFINDILIQIDLANNNKEILLSVINSFYKIVDKSNKDNKKRWVEKTPYNNYYFPLLKKWFDDGVVCLHMVRNPYDNFASYRHKIFQSLTIKRFCSDYVFHKKLIKIAQKKIKNYYVINYEDLVNNPEKTLKLICKYLNINFSDTLLRPTFLGAPWYGNSSHGNKFITISNKSIGVHKKILNKKEIFQIKQCLEKPNLFFKLKIFKRIIAFKFKWTFPYLYKLIYKILYVHK